MNNTYRGKNLLSDPNVQEILMDITDDEKRSFPIIECILNGKTNDLEIAEETEIKLNTVRKVLYKLYDAGIAHTKKVMIQKLISSFTAGNSIKKRYLIL